MTGIAGLDDARLSVLLDLRHPLAYLALHPAVAFADRHGIAVNWLPLSVPPLKAPTVERADDDRGLRHRRHRARAVAREIETYAAARGLALRDPYRSGSVDAAHLGWLWLRERDPQRLPAFLVELFRRYWCLEIDASDPGAVAGLIATLGGDAHGFAGFAAEEGPQLGADLADELRGRGLFQVPAFVVEEEVFYGRQHLPMIRWILEGRTGPVPI